MLIIAGFVLGAILGALSARRRRGSALDLAQFAAVGGILGGLAGAVATVLILR